MAVTDTLQIAVELWAASIPDIQFALIATIDGFPVACTGDIPSNDSIEYLAAVAASTFALCEQLNKDFKHGDVSEIRLAGENNQVFLYTARRNYILVVGTPSKVNEGLIHLEARRFIQQIPFTNTQTSRTAIDKRLAGILPTGRGITHISGNRANPYSYVLRKEVI